MKRFLLPQTSAQLIGQTAAIKSRPFINAAARSMRLPPTRIQAWMNPSVTVSHTSPTQLHMQQKRTFATIPKYSWGSSMRLSVGDTCTMTNSFTSDDVHRFGESSHDWNPVHYPDLHQQTTESEILKWKSNPTTANLPLPKTGIFRFSQPIVHGLLTASLIGTVFATHLPGSIYLSQNLNFKAPVYYNEPVTVKIEVIKIDRKRVTCKTTVEKVDTKTGQIVRVIDGEASVLVEGLQSNGGRTAEGNKDSSSAGPENSNLKQPSTSNLANPPEGHSLELTASLDHLSPEQKRFVGLTSQQTLNQFLRCQKAVQEMEGDQSLGIRAQSIRSFSTHSRVSTHAAKSTPTPPLSDPLPTTNRPSPPQLVSTFPSIRLNSLIAATTNTATQQRPRPPVDVSLIAQLGHGSGSQLFESVSQRQQQHKLFIDALEEPSTCIAGTDFENGEKTAIYTFSVGPQGHPFHRHAGHRIFVGISGSGGCQLRFSTATVKEIETDPSLFIRHLSHINIPGDCLFTVRFQGETWHQFQPLQPHTGHPAFVALSVHSDELGGDLSEELRQTIRKGEANIPSLTQIVPTTVSQLLNRLTPVQLAAIPTVHLSLDAPAGSAHRQVCDVTRNKVGRIRRWVGQIRRAGGFLSHSGGSGHQAYPIVQLPTIPSDSLLLTQLNDDASEGGTIRKSKKRRLHHEDMFSLKLPLSLFQSAHAPQRFQTTDSMTGQSKLSASHILYHLLDGFLKNPPPTVTGLMRFRNKMVRPLGLRTSELGCPVSSLGQPITNNTAHSTTSAALQKTLFRSRFPVRDQSVNAEDSYAQVILGANDKHLKFRSCVAVRIVDSDGSTATPTTPPSSHPLGYVEINLGTRVHCLRLFGHVYMWSIDLAHRKYVSPEMIRWAVDYMLTGQQTKQI